MDIQKAKQHIHTCGGLLQTCQNIHMFLNGSFPDAFANHDMCAYTIEALEVIQEHWQPPSKRSLMYDAAVYQLMIATIDEFKLFKENEND